MTDEIRERLLKTADLGLVDGRLMLEAADTIKALQTEARILHDMLTAIIINYEACGVPPIPVIEDAKFLLSRSRR